MDARTADFTLIDIAARTNGAVTHEQLRQAGLSRHQIQRRIGRLLLPIARGVFVIGPVTPMSLRSAALLAVPGSALSHSTAAELHRLPAGTAPDVVEVAAIGRTRIGLDGVRYRSTIWLPDADVSLIDGVGRVTTIARTVCDLAWEISPGRLTHLTEFAVTSRACTVVELQACILSYRRRGRNGSAALGRFALARLEGGAMAASELERVAVRLLEDERLTGWQAQFVPPWYDGVSGVVDFAWPKERLVFEVDGRRWHTMTQAFDEDRRRDQLAVAAGWRTIRAGWQQLRSRPAEIADTIRAALAA